MFKHLSIIRLLISLLVFVLLLVAGLFSGSKIAMIFGILGLILIIILFLKKK